MLVTDVVRKMGNGEIKRGFYMQGYLKENLDGIPDYLKKKWDVVGIITGHGKVRIGKSRMAFQVGYYCAWMLAGGRMVTEWDEQKRLFILKKIVKPKFTPRFSLKENVAFKPEELTDKAKALFEKYGPNQVLVYDEGREGLDSRVMDAINSHMEDFFQKCGFMGHVILIVLPNFFKLHDDYAVARSLFLIDVFADKQKRRGYFNFYDEVQKEWLYFLGKKRIGITQKYNAAHESFWGKFTNWFPFDEKEYDDLKMKSFRKKSVSKLHAHWKRQRDALIYILKKKTEMKNTEIAIAIAELTELNFDEKQVAWALEHYGGKQEELADDDE